MPPLVAVFAAAPPIAGRGRRNRPYALKTNKADLAGLDCAELCALYSIEL